MTDMEIIDFAIKWRRKISPMQEEIIRLLVKNNGEFCGSYRDLCAELGKSTSQRQNLCQKAHILEDMGIVSLPLRGSLSETKIILNPKWIKIIRK